MEILGPPIFRCELLVSGRVNQKMTNNMTDDAWFATLCLRIAFLSGFTFYVAMFPLHQWEGSQAWQHWMFSASCQDPSCFTQNTGSTYQPANEEWSKPVRDIPYAGWLIGILLMAYFIILPKSLGSIIIIPHAYIQQITSHVHKHFEGHPVCKSMTRKFTKNLVRPTCHKRICACNIWTNCL